MDIISNLELDFFLERFADPCIREFVKRVWSDETNKKFTERRRKHALKTAHIMLEFLKARHYYSEIAPNKQADTMIAACLLHNILFDRKVEHWRDVFILREKYGELALEIAKELQGTPDGIQFIFQLVEGQLGEEMPVFACHPVPGQPTYYVWEILWIYYNKKLVL